MLELPEAITLAKQLNETVKGKSIRKVIAGASPHGFAFFYEKNPEAYPAMLEGRTIEKARSFGGFVEMEAEGTNLTFQDGANLKYIPPGRKVPAKHQLYIEFSDGSALVCTVQMYAALFAFPKGADIGPYYVVANEKPSPLSNEFDHAWFQGICDAAKPTLSVKALLATEQRIPGLGNGVLQDILFSAGIHPKRKMKEMGPEHLDRLFDSMKSVLGKMAQLGGRDTEKGLHGKPGGYQTILSAKTLAYPCPVCGGGLVRQAYLGGNVYFCPTCQPL